MTQRDEVKAKRRKRAWLAVRVGGTLLGLTYVALMADLGGLVDVALSIPISVPLLIMLVMVSNIGLGALRWKVVLWAYGR